MRTAYQETSRIAYRELLDTGKGQTQKDLIMSFIQPGRDYSLQELVEITGLPINIISGRCNDLRKIGLLVLGEKRKCSITRKPIAPVKRQVVQGVLFS